jgi:hypothetical protein
VAAAREKKLRQRTNDKREKPQTTTGYPSASTIGGDLRKEPHRVENNDYGRFFEQKAGNERNRAWRWMASDHIVELLPPGESPTHGWLQQLV